MPQAEYCNLIVLAGPIYFFIPARSVRFNFGVAQRQPKNNSSCEGTAFSLHTLHATGNMVVTLTYLGGNPQEELKRGGSIFGGSSYNDPSF